MSLANLQRVEQRWDEQIRESFSLNMEPMCAILVVRAQLFTRKAAQLLYSNQRLQRWCFDVELLFLAQHLGVPTVETSVNWTEIPGQHAALY